MDPDIQLKSMKKVDSKQDFKNDENPPPYTDNLAQINSGYEPDSTENVSDIPKSEPVALETVVITPEEPVANGNGVRHRRKVVHVYKTSLRFRLTYNLDQN